MSTVTLHQGDCLDIMPAIPAGSVDMILCDLPYGTTQNKWDSIVPLPAYLFGSKHPTQKPVALMEYLYTNEGETVLDNCMGSGATGVACVNTDRNFIGIEKDADYFATASKRIQEAELAVARNETDWLADLGLPVIGPAPAIATELPALARPVSD